MPYFSSKPSSCPCPNMGRPGIVTIIVQTPKYLSPLPNWATAVSSSGLFMKLTKRLRMSLSNSCVLRIVSRYFAFSSRFNMFMKAELYTRCMPRVRTK